MASLQQLSDDVMQWLNRRDIAGLIPGWVSMVETEIAETLRHRCMLESGFQNIDAAYISLPSDFATMESIRDSTTGDNLRLEDTWSGSWTEVWPPSPTSAYAQINPSAPCRAYRIWHDCIEFLPHPIIPDPPDPSWVPQQVLMQWYAKPRPLVLPADTNPVLETLYGVYLFGLCKVGAVFELDDDRAQQMDAQWQQTITRANLWTQQSQYSGAPYRELPAVVF